MFNIRRLPPVSIVIGLPGTGKTTCAAAVVRKCNRLKIPVYSNVPLIGAYKLQKSDIGKYALQDCVLIIDECGLEFDNRDFDKTFRGPDGKAMLEYIKLIRHQHDPENKDTKIKGARLICFSQTVDIDLKIRSLAGLLYLCRKSIIPGVSVFHRVIRKIDVDKDGRQLCDMLTLRMPFMRLFSSRIIRPLYYKYFDSYDCPALPHKDWEPWQSVNA